MASKLNIQKTDMPFTVMSYEADTDYILARMINFVGPGFYGRAGFLAQMACEKYLKALTIQNEKQYADNCHHLLRLAELCEKYDPYFSEAETKRVLQQFDVFTEVGRYGGASKFDPLSKGQSSGGFKLEFALGMRVAGAIVWTANHIQDLDGFVFKTRSMLDFKALKQPDGLQAVLDNNKGHILVGAWQFPLPIREVLTHQNKYYRA